MTEVKFTRSEIQLQERTFAKIIGPRKLRATSASLDRKLKYALNSRESEIPIFLPCVK